jgi:CheY-like chemotaxis protein
MRTAMPSLEASLEAMESEMSCEPLPESGNTATPHGATRILLADGSRADLDDACSALQALGHAFDAVGSAQEAFARHAEHPYDLILLEAGIAAANDFAALPRLRSLSADRVPLIACVSDISEARRDAFLRADMDDICAKPLVKSQLSRLLGLWLPAADGRDGSEAGPGADLLSVASLFGDSFDGIVAMFHRDGDERLQALRRSMDGGDRPTLARIAHALGGSCASIGGWRMAGLCRALELQCLAGLDARWPQLLQAIEQEYLRLRAQLERVLQAQAQARPEAPDAARSRCKI